MDIKTIDLHLTVGEVLQTWPQTFAVFMKHKTKCVGCFMQQFCSLNDVADIYHFSLEELMDELETVSGKGT